MAKCYGNITINWDFFFETKMVKESYISYDVRQLEAAHCTNTGH